MKAKRTVAGILACTMLAAAVSVQVSAAGTSVTLSGESVRAEAGETFSVDISLTDVPASKINTIDFGVNYDASALDITSVTLGSIADVAKDDPTATDAPVFATSIQDGQIAVSWTTGMTSDAWIASDGVFMTISGTVKDGTADGVYPLSFAAVDRETYEGSGTANSDVLIGCIYGADCTEYDVTTSDGSVIVGAATTTETPATTTTTDGTTVTSGKETTTTESTKDTQDTKQTADTKDTQDTADTKDTQSTTVTTKRTAVSGGDVDDVLYGDVNLDNSIDLTDAILLNKYCADVVSLEGQGYANADCTADGNVDNNDAIALLRFLVHIITSLPGE